VDDGQRTRPNISSGSSRLSSCYLCRIFARRKRRSLIERSQLVGRRCGQHSKFLKVNHGILAARTVLCMSIDQKGGYGAVAPIALCYSLRQIIKKDANNMAKCVGEEVVLRAV
jgi:hypothetical protein